MKQQNEQSIEDRIDQYFKPLSNMSVKTSGIVFASFMLSWMLYGILKLFGVFTFSWGWVFAYPVLLFLLIAVILLSVIFYIVVTEFQQILNRDKTVKPVRQLPVKSK